MSVTFSKIGGTGCPPPPPLIKSAKARLYYKTNLISIVLADKEQGPRAIQSLSFGLEYTETAVLDPATL